MAETLVLPRKKYIRAKELDDVKLYVGKTFITRKNNTTKAVKLVEVKRSKVYLEHIEDRADSFSVPLNKFLDYYELPASALLQNPEHTTMLDTAVAATVTEYAN